MSESVWNGAVHYQWTCCFPGKFTMKMLLECFQLLQKTVEMLWKITYAWKLINEVFCNIGETENISLTKQEILRESCFVKYPLIILSVQFFQGKRLLNPARLCWVFEVERVCCVKHFMFKIQLGWCICSVVFWFYKHTHWKVGNSVYHSVKQHAAVRWKFSLFIPALLLWSCSISLG